MKNYIVIIIISLVFLPQIINAIDGDQILQKVDERLFPDSFESYRKIINEEPNGNVKEFVFFTLKKGRDQVAMLYIEPAIERGRATLRLGDNMWLYIPNIGRPIRITSMQSVIGGVFSNADIMQLDYSVEYSAEIYEETSELWILNANARSKTVAYDKLKMWIQKDNYNLIKIEAFASTGILIKTIEFKELKDFGGGITRPAVMETTSPLYKNYKSVMVYAGMKKRVIPDEVFTLAFLNRLEELR